METKSSELNNDKPLCQQVDEALKREETVFTNQPTMVYHTYQPRWLVNPIPPDPLRGINVEAEYAKIKLKECKLPSAMRKKIVIRVEGERL